MHPCACTTNPRHVYAKSLSVELSHLTLLMVTVLVEALNLTYRLKQPALLGVVPIAALYVAGIWVQMQRLKVYCNGSGWH